MATNNSIEQQPMQPRSYGIDELRYQRAVALTRYELTKMRLLEDVEAAKSKIPSAVSGKGIMGKILGSLNYMDYALIAYRIFTKIRKFRKKNRD